MEAIDSTAKARRRKEILPRVLLSLLILALLASSGCQPRSSLRSASAPKATEIQFAYWALNAREVRVITEIVNEFETSHFGVRVRVVGLAQRYYEKLLAMFAAGIPPDVFVINHGRLSDFARRRVLADLAPLFRDCADLRASQFVPAAFQTFRAAGDVTGDPGLWGIPQDWGPTNLVLYDKTAFDAAGMGYPHPGWTWSDFATACRELTVRSSHPQHVRYGAAVCLYPYACAAWFLQAGGGFLSGDGRHLSLRRRENIRALEFLVGLRKEGVIQRVDPTQDTSLEDFLSGKVAMAFVTPYSISSLRERARGRRWGISAPLVGERRATGCIPTGIAISASSRSKRAAAAFVRFWVTRGAERRAAAGFCVPAWLPALRSKHLEDPRGFGPEIARLLREAAAYAHPIPPCATLSYERLLSDLRGSLEQVFAVGRSPVEAL